jgi:hypothetical protein
VLVAGEGIFCRSSIGVLYLTLFLRMLNLQCTMCDDGRTHSYLCLIATRTSISENI